MLQAFPSRTPLRAPRDPAAQWQAVLHQACAPYRRAGRFAWHFARGKLGRDPVFQTLLRQGWLRPRARVVDIGCGQGLLAALLAAVDDAHAAGRWPATWAAAPAGCRYHGIELMARDVARAEAALQGRAGRRDFVCADMREAALPACDAVVILDVLHYVPHADQRRVLAAVHAALAPGGRLLLRVGDAAQRRRYAISQWVDRLVTHMRGHRAPPTHGRTLVQWQALLAELGFSVVAHPMSQGTPFANVLLLATRGEGAA